MRILVLCFVFRSSIQRALGWNIDLTEVRTLMEEAITDFTVEGAVISV